MPPTVPFLTHAHSRPSTSWASFACVVAFLVPVVLAVPAAEAAGRNSILVTPITVPDLDGDGIHDIILYESESDAEWGGAASARFEARSGATDRILWSRSYTKGTAWTLDTLRNGAVHDVIIAHELTLSQGAWQVGYVRNETTTIDVVEGDSGNLAWSRSFSGSSVAWSSNMHGMPLARQSRVIGDGHGVRAAPAGTSESAIGREDVMLSVIDREAAATGVTSVTRIHGETGTRLWDRALVPFPGATPPAVVALPDVTGDGLPDWAATSSLNHALGSVVTLDALDGVTGQQVFQRSLPMVGWPSTISVEKIGGAVPRLLVLSPQSPTISVLDAAPDGSRWQVERSLPVYAFIAPDTNGDGTDDVTIVSGAGAVAVIETIDSASGALVATTRYAAPVEPADRASFRAEIVPDVDGDGYADILILQEAWRYSDGAGGVMSRVFGSFARATLWSESGTGFAGAKPFADVTGDGRGDLLILRTIRVTGAIEATWAIYDGTTGNRVWATERTYPYNSMVDRWAVLAPGPDVDRDGAAEILLTVKEVEIAWGATSWYVKRSETTIEALSGSDGTTVRSWRFMWT